MISFEVLLYAYPAKTVMWYTHYMYMYIIYTQPIATRFSTFYLYIYIQSVRHWSILCFRQRLESWKYYSFILQFDSVSQKFQFILSEWIIFVTLDRTFEHLSAFENAIERYQNYARLSTVDPPTKCHIGVLVTGWWWPTFICFLRM